MKLKAVVTIVSVMAVVWVVRAAEEASTPKGSLKAFARATREADRQKLRSFLYPADETEARMADAMADATAALARLRLAAIERFGEASARVLNGGVPSEDEIRLMDAATEKIDGDRATVSMKGGPRSGQMQLVRVEGMWKIAVGQGMAGKTPQQIEGAIATLQKTARIVGEITEEVTAGKYKSAREAADALALKAQRAAQPASQPAK
jgi:hypothetical protein